jgi:hypothetical protein
MSDLNSVTASYSASIGTMLLKILNVRSSLWRVESEKKNVFERFSKFRNGVGVRRPAKPQEMWIE